MTRTIRFALPVLGLAVVLAAPRPAAAGDQGLDTIRQAQKLTGQVNRAAHDIRLRASNLTALARETSASHDSHYAHLEDIRDVVNRRLQPAFRDLLQLKQDLPAVKQAGIDRMLDAAQRLAIEADGLMRIQQLDRRVTPARIEAYRERANRLLEQSQHLARTSDALSDIAEAYVKAADLDLPAFSG